MFVYFTGPRLHSKTYAAIRTFATESSDRTMSLTTRRPAMPARATESPRQGRVAAAIRHSARAALAGAKQVAQAVLVLSIFAVMLTAAMAMGLLIWVPHFHVNS
jgi:hypothetical protein